MWSKTSFFFALMLMSTVALAIEVDTCEVGSPCSISWGATVNASNESQIILGQICNITLYDNSSTILNNSLMVNDSYGWHTFQWTPNMTGLYPYSITCILGADSSSVGGVIQVNFSDMFNFIPIVLMIIAGVFLAISYLFKQDVAFRVLFLFLSIGTIYLVSSMLINYDNPNQISTNLTSFYHLMLGGTMFFVLYLIISVIIMIYDHFMAKKQKESEQEGYFS